MPPLKLTPVTRIVLIYVAISALWIVFSDRILEILVTDEVQVSQLQTIKGLFFIAFSGATVYVLLQHEFSQRQRVEDALRELNDQLEERITGAVADLKTANERLSELNEAQRALVDEVSHALRTPLTTINMRLDLIERVGVERALEYLPGVRNQVDILNNMVTGLLNLSQVEEESHEAVQTIDLNQILERVVEAHIAYAQDKGLALDFFPHPSLPVIEAHAEQLDTAFSNLTGNAIKYTDTGGITIRGEYDDETGFVIVHVKDTGRGIDPTEIKHLFKRFYRTPSAKASDIPGTGLGLGIVHAIVERHHGRIEVTSTPGQGSTFSVYLPLVQPRDQETAQA